MRRADREITDAGEIRRILGDCQVCRIGMSDRGEVYIVPMNFGCSDGAEDLSLYFHCASQGRKLDILRANPRVAFEMDCGCALVEGASVCAYSYRYACVLGTGTVEFVEPPAEKAEALVYIMAHQTGKTFPITKEKAAAVTVFRIKVETLSCKRNE